MKNTQNSTDEKNIYFEATNDYMFKRLFGKVGNEDITKDLVSSILGKKINKIELNENPDLPGDFIMDKECILDINAMIEGNIKLDIVLLRLFPKSNLFGASQYH